MPSTDFTTSSDKVQFTVVKIHDSEIFEEHMENQIG
jgi:hypothetical protein